MTQNAHLATLDVEYTAGVSETAADYPDVAAKLAKATDVVETALRTYESPAVLWSGDGESTLLAYLVRTVLDESEGLSEPPVVFLNPTQYFADVEEFVVRWSANWGFDLEVVAAADTERALTDCITERGFDAVLTSARWADVESDSQMTFFGACRDTAEPPYDRVRPLLPFTDADVWDATWTEMVPETVADFPINGLYPTTVDDVANRGYGVRELPVCPRYFQGYRSLTVSAMTELVSETPPWCGSRSKE